MRFNNRKIGGFSLLELIIVLVIIGIIVAAVTLSISDRRNENAHLEARRLAARLSLAIDEAILTNQELGLEVSQKSYRFLTLEGNRWHIINTLGERQLVLQKLPEGMEIQLEVEGLFAQFQGDNTINKLYRAYDENEQVDEDTFDADTEQTDSANEKANEEAASVILRPHIYLMTSGEINPFILVIGYEQPTPLFYRLTATFNGKVTLEGPFKESANFLFGDK